ncbi:MFS transporter [Kiloniella laminariae]|uniref:MFS transporter n=1 Tax=Kiloniella laminariae TaxID=454162 RepID=UPI00036F57AD|nr:MFS transporter [Kiloniella laminariae]
MEQSQGKWIFLAVLALCQVAAMALWFSASAVVPALTLEYSLSPFQQALFTSSVQVGFVVGSLVSTLSGAADRLPPRLFFLISALIAAAANAAMLLPEATSPLLPLFRFITGVCMAGIYPVGMRMAATWAKGDMGLLVGVLVGALTLGSATPHLFNAVGGIDWRFTIQASSWAAVAAGLGILFFRLGPAYGRAPQFHIRQVLFAWRIKSLRLANLGYLGHMWELYAMWAWIGLFLLASFSQSMSADQAAYQAKLATFATVGIGAIGCLLAGYLADRLGRTTLTITAMLISGSCALGIGFFFGASPWLLLPICLIWGFSIVADSAQFSASIAELAETGIIGTMLTLQTSLGFTLTLVTIHLMPYAVEFLGWHYAFAPLALGPFLGVWAMACLRKHPDAIKLACGKK